MGVRIELFTQYNRNHARGQEQVNNQDLSSRHALGLVTHLCEGFLQSVLTLLQEVIVSQQVGGMLPSIPEQKLHAFHLAASRLQY